MKPGIALRKYSPIFAQGGLKGSCFPANQWHCGGGDSARRGADGLNGSCGSSHWIRSSGSGRSVPNPAPVGDGTSTRRRLRFGGRVLRGVSSLPSSIMSIQALSDEGACTQAGEGDMLEEARTGEARREDGCGRSTVITVVSHGSISPGRITIFWHFGDEARADPGELLQGDGLMQMSGISKPSWMGEREGAAAMGRLLLGFLARGTAGAMGPQTRALGARIWLGPAHALDGRSSLGLAPALVC